MLCASPAIKTVAALLLALLLTAGCATAPQGFNKQDFVTATNAAIFIYRPDASANILLTPTVVVDGQSDVIISNNQFYTLQVGAGPHHIKLLLAERYAGNHELVVDMQAGQAYFLRITSAVKFQQNKPYDRRFDILLVAETEALPEIARCKPVEIKSSPSSTPPASETPGYSGETFRNPFSR